MSLSPEEIKSLIQQKIESEQKASEANVPQSGGSSLPTQVEPLPPSKLKILWYGVAPYIKCYDEKTEILTDNGWKYFKNLTRKEKVMTYNTQSKELQWQIPKDHIVYSYEGPMYSLEGKRLSLLVTPEHRMLVKKRQKNSSWRDREELAKTLEGKYVKYLKTGKWKGKINLSFERGKIEDWVKFLGYYLSEGHIDHNPINGNYTVSLTQTGPLRKKMKRIFQKITPFKVYDAKHHISVRDKRLWSFLKVLGYSHQKFIPKEIKELPSKYLKLFLKAYNEGDGCGQNNYTSSVRLRDDLQEVSLKAGYGSDYYLYVPEGKVGTFGKSQKDCWRVSMTRKEVGVNKGRKMDKFVRYKGRVYCLEVPNSWLVVRREGKVVISGNSGYGVVAANCVDRLIAKGYPTIIAAYYGIDSGGFLKLGNTYVVPVDKNPGDQFGFASVLKHKEKFNMDIILYMTDFWVARPLAERTDKLYVYTPIDHENYATEQQETMKKFAGLAIPSLHGVKEVAKYGIKAHYLPHGVDLGVYKPVPETEKVKCREYFRLKPEQFVVGIVAENNDNEPRKGWDAMMNAVKIFLDNNPDARKDFKLMCHTNPYNPKGYNLIGLSKNLKIEDVITWQDPYMKLLGMPPSLMMVLYNSFDVLFNLASREGFCLPMLEAQACAIPSITNKFSAMIERVNYGKCGWLVKPKGLRFSPINAQTSIPDEYGAADALEEAYNNDKLRQMYGKRSLEYSKRFSWDLIIDKHFVPWLEDIELSFKKKPLEERKIA